MKKIIVPFILVVLVISVWSCKTVKQTGASGEKKIVTDSTEYGIIIMDNDFDRWYLMNFSPAMDFSNDYYRTWNRLGINNWNSYYMRNRFGYVITNPIDYDSAVDYGLEVNRKLYWYFKYCESIYRIRLLR